MAALPRHDQTPRAGLQWLLALLSVMAAAILMVVDRQWPNAGLWVFAVLSLSLGMGHGALDTALLLLQFTPVRRAAVVAVLYLGMVVAAGLVLSLSVGWALLALLAMSLWHFGELYRHSFAARMAVGGAGVMAPMLLSHDALKALIEPALVGEPFAPWHVWQTAAMVWALGAVLWALWLASQWFATGGPAQAHNALHKKALAEVAGVVLLNAFFSPLMAFALYFGLWHSMGHIRRVARAAAQHNSQHQLSLMQLAWLLAVAAVVTALLLLALWHYLPALALAANVQTGIVQWLVVALGAVTLPHMVLVGYSHSWLGRY